VSIELPLQPAIIFDFRCQLLRAKSEIRFHGSQDYEQRSRMGGRKVGLSFPTVCPYAPLRFHSVFDSAYQVGSIF
jgi:hypothetical protein